MAYELARLGETSVLINWANDADPGAGAYDDTTADLLMAPPVLIEFGRDADRSFGRPRVALATWGWDNTARTYSRENTASPIRGDIRTGRRVWIQKAIGGGITMADTVVTMADPVAPMGGRPTTRLFTGTIDEPKEVYGPGPGRRSIVMRALGAMAHLQAADDVTIGLQAGITTGAFAVLILQAAGLTADEYVVDPEMISNGRTLDYAYADRERPFELLIRVWASEGPTAAFYEDAEGRAVLEGNSYLFLTTRCNTVQQTFYADPTAGPSFVGLVPLPRDETIVNDVVFQAEQRAVQATQQVWEYNGSIALSAAEAVTVIARVGDPLSAFTTPVLTTDYTVSGTALASVTAVALGALAVAITFTAGAGSATVGPPAGGNGPRLRGQPLALISTLDVTNNVDTSASQAENGVHSLPSSVPRPLPGVNPTDLAAIADAWALAYQDGRPAYQVTVVNRTGAIQWEQLARRVSDLIGIVDTTESGATMQLTIHSIRHEINGDQHHRTTFGCEQRIEQTWGRFDSGLYDTALYGQ
jgi:hypothetical protein